MWWWAVAVDSAGTGLSPPHTHRLKCAGDLVKTTPRGLVYKEGECSRLQGQHKGQEWKKVPPPPTSVAFLKPVSQALAQPGLDGGPSENNGREGPL